jgi:glutamate synthase (NADPH/NADH) small chain
LQNLTTKERLAIPPQKMPELAPEVRSKTMDEVAIGYSAEEAKKEALRCLNCKKPGCIDGCPVRIDIPGFVLHIAEGNFQNAIDKIKETSLLPAVCGRVCPQEKQCQKKCVRPVAIGRLERFAADWESASGTVKIPCVKPETGKRVAVVGSGPAGLVVAADVRREGHGVTIFEAFHKLGGVMRYGIPEFRLPNAVVDRDIEILKKMGVEFKTNFVVGRTRKLKDLFKKDGYDAVFLGVGAGLPLFIGIIGEDLNGVFSANEFLTRANLMRAYEKDFADTPIWEGKQVAVLGGGNVAMDAARMAIRLGAEKVRIIYRRTLAEMPARAEEIHHAMEEGVEFCYLQNPSEILGDEKGFVQALKIDRYKLGAPDEKGRPRPIKIEGESFEMPVDTVLVSIGNGSNFLISQGVPELKMNKRGNIELSNPETNATYMERVFAGGDIVLGAATVILAMGEGRRAAKGINEMLAN